MSRSVVQLLGPSTGGIRVHVGELSRRLAARGWTVLVAGPAGVMGDAGAQDAVVPVPQGWHPLVLRRSATSLRRLLRERDADVLHAHGLKAAAVALTIRHRPPLVLTVHNLVVGTHAGRRAAALRRAESAILRRADHVIAISDEIVGRITPVVPEARRSFVLPVAPARRPTLAAEEVRRVHGVPADAPLVVIVARLHPQKDLGTFLRAIAHVHAARPRVRALVVGDGPDRESLLALRDELGLGDVVTFAGHRPNPADEMSAADVVALSSRWEGSPLVVAEYLSLGRPLVTTAVGTVARHLTDGVDARIVPIGDARALGDAIVGLVDDPEAAAAMGRAGCRVAQDVFDPDRAVDGVERAYAAVGR